MDKNRKRWAVGKTLGLPSKSQVLHRALQELQKTLAREIERSVRKCAKADAEEHPSWI